MTVAQPSTPANYFHLLRRHVLDGVSRPMVVFTPKSMLRNKSAVSAVEDFTESKFRSVIDDPGITDPEKVRRVLLVAGKLYYELAAQREKEGIDDVAIVRVEQFYPVPRKKLAAALENYPNVDDIRWFQDEPENQGAWPFFGLHLPRLVPERLSGLGHVSRRAMSAPASGSGKVHEVEQAEIIRRALH